jgi:hypothetical protein
MTITATHEEAQLLSEQSTKIINLILEAQTELGRKDLIEYFKSNPGLEEALLSAAEASLKSYPLVLRGLKQKLGSMILPDLGESDHDADWLTVGEVFVGWTGFLHTHKVDRPYVVTASTEAGYEWRYLDDPESTSYQPMLNDPHLRFAGWHKIEVSDDPVVEIEAYQQSEIEALTGQLVYLSSNQFMA